MKAIAKKQSIIIASTAILIAIITFISINVFGTVGPVTNLGNAVSRPIRNLSSTVTGIFERIYSSIYRFDELMEAYERLHADNAELRANFRESEDLAADNAMLRELLEFGARHPDFTPAHAVFVSWSGSNWSHSFSINRGYANSNVTSGAPVITEHGVLIGQVTDVGATTSTVVTVLDTTFSAGAYVGDGDGRATLRGDFNLMRNGLIMLDHIDDDQIVRPGDQVVTSGRGGVFPRGLIVGDVVDLHIHNTGIGRFATVRPARVFDAMAEVFVIVDFEPEIE
ncbi:MAG: rod shape-determining protein MreC [Oscillospiraceae bacterium]|nr:rod shape-determining protein MreC [Oscillospiraceae bacterium]